MVNDARVIFELTELVGGLAHELRNPLSTMMINLKLLAEDLQDPHAHPDDARRRALQRVELVQREAQRLQSLFDDVLSIADPRGLELAPVDLCELVGRLATFIDPMTRSRGIHLHIDRPDGPILCPVDDDQLGQALLNLVLNAQDAMPQGGDLTLAVQRENDAAVVTVADTGTGIADEHKDGIWRPFFSTKARGTGLGLSVTRRIITQHGGTIGCASEPGRGTTFVIRLPLKLPSDAPMSPDDYPATAHSNEGYSAVVPPVA